MSRPKIKIELESIDFVFECLAAIGLIVLMILPAYYFDQLPDLIPSHFDWYGKPDTYSNKMVIWLLPVVGIIMYIILSLVVRYPHTFNYTSKITEENAEQEYRKGGRLIRILKAIICCFFAYLVYCQILIAMELKDGLGKYFIPIFLFLVLGTTAYYLIKPKREK